MTPPPIAAAATGTAVAGAKFPEAPVAVEDADEEEPEADASELPVWCALFPVIVLVA